MTETETGRELVDEPQGESTELVRRFKGFFKLRNPDREGLRNWFKSFSDELEEKRASITTAVDKVVSDFGSDANEVRGELQTTLNETMRQAKVDIAACVVTANAEFRQQMEKDIKEREQQLLQVLEGDVKKLEEHASVSMGDKVKSLESVMKADFDKLYGQFTSKLVKAQNEAERSAEAAFTRAEEEAGKASDLLRQSAEAEIRKRQPGLMKSVDKAVADASSLLRTTVDGAVGQTKTILAANAAAATTEFKQHADQEVKEREQQLRDALAADMALLHPQFAKGLEERAGAIVDDKIKLLESAFDKQREQLVSKLVKRQNEAERKAETAFGRAEEEAVKASTKLRENTEAEINKHRPVLSKMVESAVAEISAMLSGKKSEFEESARLEWERNQTRIIETARENIRKIAEQMEAEGVKMQTMCAAEATASKTRTTQTIETVRESLQNAEAQLEAEAAKMQTACTAEVAVSKTRTARIIETVRGSLQKIATQMDEESAKLQTECMAELEASKSRAEQRVKALESAFMDACALEETERDKRLGELRSMAGNEVSAAKIQISDEIARVREGALQEIDAAKNSIQDELDMARKQTKEAGKAMVAEALGETVSDDQWVVVEDVTTGRETQVLITDKGRQLYCGSCTTSPCRHTKKVEEVIKKGGLKKAS